MTSTIQPKVIDRDHFMFSVNGDSFGDLLAKANCRDAGKFLAIAPRNFTPPVYDCRRYRFKHIPRVTRDLRDVLTAIQCQWMDCATIRELLGFAVAFPNIASRGGRIIALGRDLICFTGGILPAIRPGSRRLVLERIEYSIGETVFTPDDRFLIRDQIDQAKVA